MLTAGNGAEGLKRLEDVQPDLIFVDLKMPGLSGLEVLERIRAKHPLMVVIVITGYATVSSAVEAMKKGAFDFLPKPFTPEELRLIAKRGLEHNRLVQQTVACAGRRRCSGRTSRPSSPTNSSRRWAPSSRTSTR